MILVMGGVGFIGVNFVFDWLCVFDEVVFNVDKLMYVGNLCMLQLLDGNLKYVFVCVDICDCDVFDVFLVEYKFCVVLYFVVESYVDCLIYGFVDFVQINVVGMFMLFEVICQYWNGLNDVDKVVFCFLYVLIDEVFGLLLVIDLQFLEMMLYVLNSLYFVMKVGFDYLVCVYYYMYGLLVLMMNCLNNYGLFQFLEKLILLMIVNVFVGKLLLVYGDGENVCDWLYVGDYCSVICEVFVCGVLGEMYNVGGWNEKKNFEVVYMFCDLFDKVCLKVVGFYCDQIIYVMDCFGYDCCYVIDVCKFECEFGWKFVEMFEIGLVKIVDWYFDNQVWVDEVVLGEYCKWVEMNYVKCI